MSRQGVQVRAVVVTTYEPPSGTGGGGEFTLWREREGLNVPLALPFAGPDALWTNAEGTVLGLVAGTGVAAAAASLTALGLDSRLDLTRAYWLVNGLAGIDPEAGALGSVAWAGFVVGDAARVLAGGDVPAAWPYGIVPVGAREPRPKRVDAVAWMRPNLFELNASLADWAAGLTRDTPLRDVPGPAAPQVLRGDVLSSGQVWHGAVLTQWARDWVGLHTGGRGRFAMAAMEDAGFCTALERLAAAGRIDHGRVLLLRGASNYTMPVQGEPAAESMLGGLPGIGAALRNLQAVGGRVLRHIVEHWDGPEGCAARLPGG